MSSNETTFDVRKEDLEVVTTRVFDAPRELVFKVCTDPDLIPKWWGPAVYTTTIDKHDLRVGGEWRFVQKEASGDESAFRGVFKEINPPEKLVYTFEYEPMPGHVLTETVRFEEVNEGTKIIDTVKYPNIEDLEGMVGMGMEGGARESMQRLATLVEQS